MKIKQLLAVKGIHYIVTRFCPKRLRSMAFDEKFRRGDWDFHEGRSTELPLTLKRYLRCGDLLILGCGGASILDSLDIESLNSVLGLDLSEEAVRIANRFKRENVSFKIEDMERFHCPKHYDVILFSESLNYVPLSKQQEYLERLAGNLKKGGVIIVTLAQAKRYRSTIELIRRYFHVVEDRNFSNSERSLLVFHR